MYTNYPTKNVDLSRLPALCAAVNARLVGVPVDALSSV